MPRVALVPLGGGEVQRLHKGSNPTWSPDGTRLAFQCYPGICTMDTDGTDLERLTKPTGHVQDEGPSWGPTGHIAFTRTYLGFDRGPDIFVVPHTGGEATPIIEKGSNLSPTWSPDGDSIAFIRGLGTSLEAPKSGFRLWRMRLDGTDLRRLTTEGAARPDWSPDGATIVFDRDSALWTIPAEGGAMHKLTRATTGRHTEGIGAFPSWSPDGKRIVYMCQTGEFDDNDLCTINADGTGRTTILDTPANEGVPAWQPDSRVARVGPSNSRSWPKGPFAHNCLPENADARGDFDGDGMAERSRFEPVFDGDGHAGWTVVLGDRDGWHEESRARVDAECPEAIGTRDVDQDGDDELFFDTGKGMTAALVDLLVYRAGRLREVTYRPGSTLLYVGSSMSMRSDLRCHPTEGTPLFEIVRVDEQRQRVTSTRFSLRGQVLVKTGTFPIRGDADGRLRCFGLRWTGY